jgi:hypothetical protein
MLPAGLSRMDASGFPCTGAALSVSGAQQELAQKTRAQLEFTTKLFSQKYRMLIKDCYFSSVLKPHLTTSTEG